MPTLKEQAERLKLQYSRGLTSSEEYTSKLVALAQTEIGRAAALIEAPHFDAERKENVALAIRNVQFLLREV